MLTTLQSKILAHFEHLTLPSKVLYTNTCIEREHPLWPAIIATIANDIKKTGMSPHRADVYHELYIKETSSIPENLSTSDTFIYLVTGVDPTSFNKTFALLGLNVDENYTMLLTEYLNKHLSSHKNIGQSLPELHFDV